ncbi:MAG: type III sulfide quinone reductase, selenoprotein subtype [Gaiellaceae bacterium]
MRHDAPIAKRILILGAGTGGTLIANKLRRRYGAETSITIVDRDDRHVYQPDLLFVPFGLVAPNSICRPRSKQLRRGIEFRLGEVERVETEKNAVQLKDGEALAYDVLIVASGTEILPEATEGLTGPGWGETAFTYYTVEGAAALVKAMEGFEGGRLVVNIVDMPIKCPVAPLEFCFLADWWLQKRGLRQKTEIVLATPLDGAFTKPVAARMLDTLLEKKKILVETEFAAGRVDGEARKLVSWDEREIAYDLLVSIPLHGGSPFVERSDGLGDEVGFVPIDQNTLQTKAAANVFALGDATNAPTSKAGAVAHFQAETLVENVDRFLSGKELEKSFDGHANCFIETGFSKALLLDFNYEVEPLPGKFPFPGIGPMALLKESRLNHLGKLAFRQLYWHLLLPGRRIPTISAQLKMAGKDTSLLRPEGGEG